MFNLFKLYIKFFDSNIYSQTYALKHFFCNENDKNDTSQLKFSFHKLEFHLKYEKKMILGCFTI